MKRLFVTSLLVLAACGEKKAPEPAPVAAEPPPPVEAAPPPPPEPPPPPPEVRNTDLNVSVTRLFHLLSGMWHYPCLSSRGAKIAPSHRRLDRQFQIASFAAYS